MSAVAEKIPTAASYTAGATSTLFGLTSLNEWALLIGIVLSIGTFTINWLYKHKMYVLQKETINKADEAGG